MNSVSKTAHPVQVPLGNLINCWDFTRAIAKSICPSLRDAKGIDCVKNTKYLLHASNILVQSPITNEERAKLSKLLPDLPILSGDKLSDGLAIIFSNAYAEHPDRELWEPVLFNDDDLTLNGWKIGGLQDEHRKLLQADISSGKIVAVDSSHRPNQWASIDTYISRFDATDYLKRHLLGEIPSSGPDVASDLAGPADPQAEDIDTTSKASSDDVIEESSGALLKVKKKREKWTEARLREIYFVYTDAEKKRGAGVKAVQARLEAERKITADQVRKLIKRYEKKYLKKTASLFPTVKHRIK